jgi:hypothetical protein
MRTDREEMRMAFTAKQIEAGFVESIAALRDQRAMALKKADDLEQTIKLLEEHLEQHRKNPPQPTHRDRRVGCRL